MRMRALCMALFVSLAVGGLSCGGPAMHGNIPLRSSDVLGHHEDYGIEGMRLNGTALEISLGRACYDTVQEPVEVLGTPVYDGNGNVLMANNAHESACVLGWPAGYARLLTTEGEYPGQATGSGRVDIDVAAAPESFWTRLEPANLEIPGVSYTLEVWLSDSVRQAALARAQQGQPELELSLAFNDADGTDDGRLQPGQSATLAYQVVNIGSAGADGVLLRVDVGGVPGVVLDAPVDVGSVGPGEALRGEVMLHTDSRLSASALVFEGSLEAASGHTASDRVVVPVALDTSPDRAWVWHLREGPHADLLAAAAARVQTVLTGAGAYVFVSDPATRQRIQRAVDLGGGSAEERFRIALDAAAGEAVERVFQLEINAMPGDELQLVLAAYETGAADRVFLADTTVPSGRSADVLDGFGRLAQSYLQWLEGGAPRR